MKGEDERSAGERREKKQWKAGNLIDVLVRP